MENTSSNDLALELLDYCLHRKRWPDELLHSLLRNALVHDPLRASRALFRIVVERLGDLFEPDLCTIYAELFSEVIAFVDPRLNAGELLDRYNRVRRPRRVEGNPERVFVLSRVTLGADVAVTSVVLDGIKRRFPAARVCFVGPRKNWELFAADRRVEHVPLDYGRQGTLGGRLATWTELRDLVSEPGSVVIDPDSRLTQLGLLPVCDEENYYFFESRGYGGESSKSLSELTSEWVRETMGIPDARAWIAPLPMSRGYDIAVSLGVGDNPEKRVADPFEASLMAALQGSIVVDKGAGGEETVRVERAMTHARAPIEAWQGEYAPFASLIRNSRLYIGYDSAGQHVAAACGVPLISIFAGYVSQRMFERWRPTGSGPIRVLQVTDGSPAKALDAFLPVLQDFLNSQQ
ncbi:MAG TPA: glycosyltransferase family 9 protein [Bryobacteraceae bacterium]|nr:glycosyltransferase family 9 protein [Bryobacteraceae bacterium]